MAERVYNILFLCPSNTERSILAEALIGRLGAGKYRGFSAAPSPGASIDPMVAEILRRENYPVTQYRPKSWTTFTDSNNEAFDFVFTLSEDLVGQPQPTFPGPAVSAHWSLPDPTAIAGREAERLAATARVYKMMATWLGIFVNLPGAALNRLELQQRFDTLEQSA